MLLEVTPSLLQHLGITDSSIESHGSASFAPAKGPRVRIRSVRVIRLKERLFPVARGLSARSESAAEENTADLLPAEAFAERMRCTRATVYEQERQGKLFSVLPPGRQNGRLFPLFQLEVTLDRELLRDLIAVYRSRSAPMNLLWDFLRTVHAEFGGLTGTQVLTRKTQGNQVQAARVRALFELSDEERREYVKDVALEDLTHAYT